MVPGIVRERVQGGGACTAARGDLVRGGTAGPRTPPGSARRAGHPGTRVRGRAGSAELSAPPPPARRPASSRVSARELSEGGCERAGPALGRCGDHRPALCQRPRTWQRRDIHLAWQLIPRGGGGARSPPYRRVAAGEARSGGGEGIPLRRASGPFSLPGGPGRGAAGGSGPISILIAGLGGPSGPRPNYRANPPGACGACQLQSLYPTLPAFSRTIPLSACSLR